MKPPAGPRAHTRLRARTGLALAWIAALCGGCGGGGGDPQPSAAAQLSYAHSQVLGQAQAQALAYVAAVPPAQAAVLTPAGGGLLNAGTTLLTAEYVPPSLADVRAACVSGNGSSIGVLDAINPGVVSVGAAVLLGAEWIEGDPEAAWTAAAAAAERWDGWENCGVKPEGPPFKSSTVVPSADGGYTEDVLIGNPATTFTTVRLAVTSLDAAEMRRSGHATTQDPRRPLQITWRVFVNAAGQSVWVERGEPAPGAASGTRGFITLFVPDRPR